jgi:hypothetical protein
VEKLWCPGAPGKGRREFVDDGAGWTYWGVLEVGVGGGEGENRIFVPVFVERNLGEKRWADKTQRALLESAPTTAICKNKFLPPGTPHYCIFFTGTEESARVKWLCSAIVKQYQKKAGRNADLD